ncbi:MAG: preprotein translocase subunit SecG, partial [Bdellovibrionaceae bacterium]|nr:preprotein translocase subunit SecG [Pseudobdellovibrionaceae bacterium]
MSILTGVFTAIFVIVCILMTLVILLQRPRSEGLGSSFGGGMTESLFGVDTTNVLTKVTIWFACGFFVLTLILAFLSAHRTQSGLDKRLDALEIQQSIQQLNMASEAMGNGTNQTVTPTPPPPQKSPPSRWNPWKFPVSPPRNPSRPCPDAPRHPAR